jgi:membrane-bound lytic murein transglycosylase B
MSICAIPCRNFEGAMREWNHSEVYRKTIVLMAGRIAGQ